MKNPKLDDNQDDNHDEEDQDLEDIFDDEEEEIISGDCYPRRGSGATYTPSMGMGNFTPYGCYPPYPPKPATPDFQEQLLQALLGSHEMTIGLMREAHRKEVEALETSNKKENDWHMRLLEMQMIYAEHERQWRKERDKHSDQAQASTEA